MNRRNVIAAIVLILVSILYGYMTAELPKRSLPGTPGPAFMPWIITVVLAGLSLLLLAAGLTAREPGSVETGAEATANAGSVLFLLALAGYIVLMPVLGFVLAGIPFFAVAMILFGERRKSWILLGSVGAPVLLFAIFRHGFSILLPRGLLPVIFG